jgi:hypothetical protein
MLPTWLRKILPRGLLEAAQGEGTLGESLINVFSEEIKKTRAQRSAETPEVVKRNRPKAQKARVQRRKSQKSRRGY